ncbi:MAG: metallophosphoesterase [Oscillospiraceae bacterium]|nr:metallophosphoesterase [Oscillospiraceae bacterium]
MKILVLSDSHGDTSACLQAVRLTAPELIVHLGDYDSDCEAISKQFEIPIKAVKGNCDLRSNRSDEAEFEVAGKRFFITYGHPYGVKTSLARVTLAARQKGADVLLFGHTHNSCYDIIDEMVLVNPGSIGGYRTQTGEKTYAVLEIKNGAVLCEIKSL